MERLDSLVLTVEKQIELIIRGNSNTRSISSNQQEETLVTKNMYNLFEHLISALLNRESSAVEDKNQRVTAAVRLHNKVRNLAPIAYAELRAVAKACSAWMLLLFNQPTPKSLCAVIKLLSRAGQESEPYSEKVSLKCITATIDLWSKINLHSLSQIMAQLELQDVKIAVFQAYLKKANILMGKQVVNDLR